MTRCPMQLVSEPDTDIQVARPTPHCAFGSFAKVWDSLDGFDNHIYNFRSTSQATHPGSSAGQGELDGSRSGVGSLALGVNDDEFTQLRTTVSEDPQRSRPWAQNIASRAALGRFSEVWHQLNSLDVALQPSRRADAQQQISLEGEEFCTHCGNAGDSSRRFCGNCGTTLQKPTHMVQADGGAPKSQRVKDDDTYPGSLHVVTVGGSLVGEYVIDAGMTVSTLKDQIALSRNELPFTLTLLCGTEILNDALALSEVAGLCAADRPSLTLLHCAPIGRCSFSAVWDSLGQLDASLGRLGGS